MAHFPKIVTLRETTRTSLESADYAFPTYEQADFGPLSF
jgi:hypothetical protein